MPHKDPEARRAYGREHYLANREQAITEASARQIRYREEDPDGFRAKHAAWQATYRQRKRKAVFDHYGWECACCGSRDQLTIDHINGDGWAHRKELFGSPFISGTAIYRWLVNNDFPDNFQTLCAPCNNSKHTRKKCMLHP